MSFLRPVNVQNGSGEFECVCTHMWVLLVSVQLWLFPTIFRQADFSPVSFPLESCSHLPSSLQLFVPIEKLNNYQLFSIRFLPHCSIYLFPTTLFECRLWARLFGLLKKTFRNSPRFSFCKEKKQTNIKWHWIYLQLFIRQRLLSKATYKWGTTAFSTYFAFNLTCTAELWKVPLIFHPDVSSTI